MGEEELAFLLLFFWFFAFSNKRFWKTDRSWEPPSPESPHPTHPPSATSLSPKSHLGDWWPRRRRTRTSSHVSRGAGGPPLPHGGRGPGSAGTLVPTGGDPGAHRRSRSPAARAWGSGLEKARQTGGLRPSRTCGPLSVLAVCTVMPTGDPAPGFLPFSGCRGSGPRRCAGGSPVGRRAAILSPWLLSLGGGREVRGLRHRPDGCPPARWLLGELAPGSPPPYFCLRSYGSSDPTPGI